jgi:hypothetical protein
MRSRFIVAPLAGAVLAAAPLARAEDEGPGGKAPLGTHVSADGSVGYVMFHRSTSEPTTMGALAWALDVHMHARSVHGFFLGYTHGEGLFGPKVTIFDGGWSWRFLGGRRVGNVSGAGYLDVGPAVGLVSEDNPSHAVAGAHVGLTFDAHLGYFVLGVAFAYRGGVPIAGPPDVWEGAASTMLRVGFVLDAGD